MVFSPALMTVTNITQALPAVATTALAHGLTTGQVVRFFVPKAYGMTQLAGIPLQVSVLSSITFSLQYSQVPFVNVDSRHFTAFVNAGTGTPCTANAIGSAPTPITNTAPQLQNNTADSLLGDATANISTVEIPF
jgi:hypothetical protein